MNARQRYASESGSLPLVLLAAIILAGVILALFTTVSTGVDTAQRDRDWHAAFQVADAGVQQAIPLIREGEDAVVANCGSDMTCTGDVDGRGSFEATYELDNDDWLVCSRGQVGDAERTACAEFGPESLFGGAGIVGIDSVDVSGSLNQMPEGVVLGTAGTFNMGDLVCSNIDSVEIYNDKMIDPVCTRFRSLTRSFPNVAQDAFTYHDDVDKRGVCSDPSVVWNSYPDDPPDAPPEPGDLPEDVNVSDPWVYGATYCARFLNLVDRGTVNLQGSVGDGAVQVFVQPSSEDTGSTSVDLRGNTRLNPLGDPLDLLFFVGDGIVDLDMRGTPDMRAIWYAPNSECVLRGTPDFYGSILCRTTDIRGAVSVHVPEGLQDLKMGPTSLTRYYE